MSFVLAMSLAGFTFIGFAPSGTMWFQQVKAPAVQACRVDVNDIPNGWPEGVSGIGPGVACADLPEKVGDKSAMDYAKKETKGVASSTKNPFGVDVKVELKGKDTSVVAVNGDKKLELGVITADSPIKVSEEHWRGDGRFVIVHLKSTKGDVLAQVQKDISSILVGGPAGRKLAEKLYDDGMKLYRKRDWSGSGKIFEEGIAADPDFAQVRYARAAAEAQGGVGRTAMIENLQWLKEHADKDAKAKSLLQQAKNDGAFDAWIGDPEVRELVGLPKVSAMDVPTRLTERDGTWTVQGQTCKSPWYTVQFKKGGNAQLTVADSCKGKKTSNSTAATYKQTPAGPFQLELKKPIAGMTLPAKSTIVLDDSYQQMKLVPDGGGEPWGGQFEPGPARLDDSTL